MLKGGEDAKVYTGGKEIFTRPQQNNEIWYTSSDGKIVNPYKRNVFGANIVSNIYLGEKGIITFDGDVTSIGNEAFKYCSKLTGIEIPNSVTSIGNNAFSSCKSLTSINIPNSVTSIGNSAFSSCSSLAEVISRSLTPLTLGTSVFNYNASGRIIYVPLISIESYKTATNWSAYATYIKINCTVQEYKSLSITADDVSWKTTTTTIHYTYIIDGYDNISRSYLSDASVLGDDISSSFPQNTTTESIQITITYSGHDLTASSIITQFSKHNVGDIAYWNGSKVDFTSYTSWSTSLGTAVGVCFIPTSHAAVWGDGKARFLAVTGVNADGSPSSSDVQLGASITKFSSDQYEYGMPTWTNTIGGSIGWVGKFSYISTDNRLYGTINVLDTGTRYSGSPYCPGPYKNDGSFNTGFITIPSHPLSPTCHLNGQSQQNDAAANACRAYSTYGIAAGNWYVMSFGEMCYLVSRLAVVKKALAACRGTALIEDASVGYYTSTSQKGSYSTWRYWIRLSTGQPNEVEATSSTKFIRPICQLI